MKWARSIHRISSQSNPDGFEPNWIAKLHAYSEFRLGWVAKSIISSFFLSSCRIRFSYYAPLPIFLTRYLNYLSCLLLPGYLFCHGFYRNWFDSSHGSSEKHTNLNWLIIQLWVVSEFVLLWSCFFFIYTKMTFLIVNPSERWFIKLTLHFLLTTQLTSPINNQFN